MTNAIVKAYSDNKEIVDMLISEKEKLQNKEVAYECIFKSDATDAKRIIEINRELVKIIFGEEQSNENLYLIGQWIEVINNTLS